MMRHVDKVNQLPVDVAEQVFETIHTLMHLYRSQQFRAMQADAPALTHMEAKVMGFFARHPAATQRDLVNKSGRDKAQIARLIAGLRERGLLDSTVDERDRRSQRLTLSAQGLDVQKQLRQHGQQLSARALHGLSREQALQLQALLDQVLTNLQDAVIAAQD